MSEIQKLREQLANAEKTERLARLKKECEELKKQYEGKCFASHTFERSSASLHAVAVHYERIFIKEDGELYLFERSVSVSRYDSLYKKSKTDGQYSRHFCERALSNNEYNPSYNLYSGYTQFRKEISLERFEQLWQGAEECQLIIKNIFDAKLPEVKMELIRQGDDRNEDVIEQVIKCLNLDIIDFKKYPNIHRYIEYATLPMFQERRWMPRIYAKQILEYHIKSLKERQAESWTPDRIYNALEYEIKAIQEFINKEL